MTFARKPVSLLLLALLAPMTSVWAGSLTVHFKNLTPESSTLYVALFDATPSLFPQQTDQAYGSQRLRITSSGIQVYFDNLKPGRYAITSFQDMNNNGKLDTNLIGIPSEPYGFSKGKASARSFGPPTFEQAAFEVGEGSLDLEIQY